MMRPNSVNRSTLALLVLCTVLALVVAIELTYPAKVAATNVAAARPATTDAPDFSETVYLPPGMDDLAEMLDRPLFYPNRQMPPEPESTAAPVATLTPLRLRLEGVAMTSDTRVAVLRDLRNNQLLQLAEGMAHDGWTLDAVTANSAVFKRNGEITELPLETDTNTSRR